MGSADAYASLSVPQLLEMLDVRTDAIVRVSFPVALAPIGHSVTELLLQQQKA
jgi:hypothetical protein